MRRLTFGRRNRSGNLLHIETEGCVVNIHVGLRDVLGRRVTRVTISPDDESRSPDEDGYYWRAAGDGRIVRDVVPGLHAGHPDPSAWACRHCGADIEQGEDGLWRDVGTVWTGTGTAMDDQDDAGRLACPDAPHRNDLRAGLHEPDKTSAAWLAEHPS